MALLNIRNLPDEVHQALRVRAAAAGRSMEAEARLILADACLSPAGAVCPKDIQDYIRGFFDGPLPTGQVDDFIAERRRAAELE